MIIEHRTFRLAAGADEVAFLAADERVQTEVAPFQPGFVRRTTARGPAGRWLVETLWYDEDCADGAAGRQVPAIAAFEDLVDPESVEIVRWSTLD